MGSHSLLSHLSTSSLRKPKMSLKVFLLITITASAAQAQEERSDLSIPALPSLADLGIDKTALLQTFAQLVDKETLVQRVGEFFDFENAGITKLGQLFAWKGDLIQPVIMFAVGAFVIYSTIELLLALIGGILDFKATLIGNIFSLFQTLLKVIFAVTLVFKIPIRSKLNALAMPDVDDMTPAAELGRRAIDMVSDAVQKALNKYN